MRPIILAMLCAARLGAQTSDSLAAGIRLFDERRFDDAAKVLASFERRAGRPGDASFYLGRLALRAGDAGRAVSLLNDAVATDPNRAGYRLWLAKALTEQALAGSKFKLPFVARRAKTEGERALALAPDSIEPRLFVAQYYLFAPGLLGGSVDKAREQADEIAKRSAYWGHVAHGLIAEHGNQIADAEREYRAAVALETDSVDASTSLAKLYMAAKRYDDAMAVTRAAIAHSPNAAYPYYGAGYLAAQSGRFLDEGAQALAKYLTLRPGEDDPGFASAHYWLGIIYRAQGKNDLARRELEAVLALAPNSKRAREALERLPKA